MTLLDRLIEQLDQEAEIAERSARVSFGYASSEREEGRAHAYRHAAEMTRHLRFARKLSAWEGTDTKR